MKTENVVALRDKLNANRDRAIQSIEAINAEGARLQDVVAQLTGAVSALNDLIKEDAEEQEQQQLEEDKEQAPEAPIKLVDGEAVLDLTKEAI